jgi:hypothetical protein
MNTQSRLTTGKSFTPVTDHHFVMTEDDLSDGRNKLGIKVNVPLDVPLCKGCDNEIIDAVCKDCELLFADLIQLTQTVSDPFLGRL